MGTFFIILLVLAVMIIFFVFIRKVICSFETVIEYEKGLLFSRGKFVRLLNAGRYLIWKILLNQSLVKVDMRLKTVAITGQEILTKDQINIKISVIIHYSIIDPVSVINKLENYTDFLHQEIQLALRELISSHNIDEITETKIELAKQLTETVKIKIKEYGIDVVQVGIRDIILPGEIKSILAKTVEAEKSAKAALIAAREEHAAARCQANTAKLIQENPVILKLKELQTIADASKHPGNTVVFTSSSELINLLKPQTDKKD